jgi:hypothetical protein
VFTGLWKIPPRFQRKVYEARQCVVGPGSLQVIPERVMYEDVRVKSKTQRRLQEVADARNMEHLQGNLKVASTTCPEKKPCGLQGIRP